MIHSANALWIPTHFKRPKNARSLFFPSLQDQRDSDSDSFFVDHSKDDDSNSNHSNSNSKNNNVPKKENNNHNIRYAQIGIIGGGASGMFAAASAAERFHFHSSHHSSFSSSSSSSLSTADMPHIVVLEATHHLMTKVLLSGGGRCNVLHDTHKPLSQLLSLGYPRGKLELQGLYTKYFGPQQAREWFEQRHVTLKTEPDGRMFPMTDQSQTIVDAIYQAATQYDHVRMELEMNQRVLSISIHDNHEERNEPKFQVMLGSSRKDPHSTNTTNMTTTWYFDSIILATGSSTKGYDIASSLGHDIITPVPSLFTLNTKTLMQVGGTFHGLAGITIPHVRLTFKITPPEDNKQDPNKKKRKKHKELHTILTQEGPLLLTHYGLSGPAALKLSAFAAREFHQLHYQCNISIHWLPELGTLDQMEQKLWNMVTLYPHRKVSSFCPLLYNSPDDLLSHHYDDNDTDTDNDLANWEDNMQNLSTSSSSSSSTSPWIPRRLWSALVHASGINIETERWRDMSKMKIATLASRICDFTVPITGKGTFKEEFVTAGGVCLKGITMKTMESKIHSGLYFCGEVLNIDGVTGGYNFMNCWCTGYMAGQSAVDRLLSMNLEK